MHKYTKTIDYLAEFFASNETDYFEIMKDAGRVRFPEAFDGESEVIQGIRNIVHGISNTYSDLSVPAGFASPSLLEHSLVGFRDMAEKQLNETLKINKKLGEPWFDVLSQSAKINSEVKEAIDYALTLADKDMVMKRKEDSSSAAIDIKDLSISEILKSVKRLKLSSALWIGGIIVALVVGAYSLGVATHYIKKPIFTPLFTENFVDREYLSLLIPEILEESPDGIETDAEAMASLLWQVKSQDGYAEFLSGKNSISVQISYSNNSFQFDWTRGRSVIPKILNRLSISPNEQSIAQLNAELNLIGVAWLPDNNQIVRSIDGGLALVGKE